MFKREASEDSSRVINSDILPDGNTNWLKFHIISVCIVMSFFYFIKIDIIVSGSMYPALQTGDVYIAKRVFSQDRNDLDRFDMVITKELRKPSYLKRIVAFSGETISIGEGQLYINGEVVKDDTGERSNSIGDEFRQFDGIVVPDDDIFIMGDNRDYSYDSREFGTLKLKSVKYKVIKVFPMHKIKKNIELF